MVILGRKEIFCSHVQLCVSQMWKLEEFSMENIVKKIVLGVFLLCLYKTTTCLLELQSGSHLLGLSTIVSLFFVL